MVTPRSQRQRKMAVFERLLSEGKLGYLACCAILRNFDQLGVDRELVKAAIIARKGAQRVLPFRYAAPRARPLLFAGKAFTRQQLARATFRDMYPTSFEPEIDLALSPRRRRPCGHQWVPRAG